MIRKERKAHRKHPVMSETLRLTMRVTRKMTSTLETKETPFLELEKLRHEQTENGVNYPCGVIKDQ